MARLEGIRACVFDAYGTLFDVHAPVQKLAAEIRYMVLPMRPQGTQGWSEEKLAKLVTRDAMIGTGLPPAAGSIS